MTPDWSRGLGSVITCGNITISQMTEFRGSRRARYLTRQRDVDTYDPRYNTAVWSDYDGEFKDNLPR